MSFDPSEIESGRRRLMRRDRTLAAAMKRIGPCGLRRRGDPYRYLVRAVLYQQISGHAARAIEARFKAAHGGRLPVASTLRKVPVARLRGLGLSRQKAVYLREIAKAFDDGSIRSRALSRLEDDAVVDVVTQIKGVGEWTAHMLMMFSLGRLDVLPVGDLGVQKGAQLLYGLDTLPTPAVLREIAEPWRPYRSIASWYLWRVLDPDDED